MLKDRIADDTRTVMNFFNEGLNVGVDDQEYISKVMRLGRLGDNQSSISDTSSSSVRPLLVSFTNYSIRSLIMNSLYKLKSAGHLFRSFIVSRDITDLERN